MTSLKSVFKGIIDVLREKSIIPTDPIAPISLSAKISEYVPGQQSDEVPRYRIDSDDNIICNPNISTIDLSRAVSVKPYGMSYGFINLSTILSVNLQNLEKVEDYGMAYSFQNCQKLRDIDLSNLNAINYHGMMNIFDGCSQLSSVTFSQLSSVDETGLYYAFNNCLKLSAISFDKLQQVGIRSIYRAFTKTAVKTLSFPSLSVVDCYCTTTSNAPFGANDTITDMYFPALTAISYNFLVNSSCTSLSALHFGKDNEALLSATSGYDSKWGAPSTCEVLFDL